MAEEEGISIAIQKASYSSFKTTTMKIIINFLIGCITLTAWGQYAPAPQQSKSIVILNATVHLGNGNVIPNAAVGFKKGKIELVADASTIRLSKEAYDTTILAEGQHLYPGFIAPAINLGLIEMEAVRATSDFYEVGEFNPHIRSLIAFNTDSEILPTVRSNGVLFTQVTPSGGVISGTSSVVHLDAWNWEDAMVLKDDGVHLHWPDLYRRSAAGFDRNKNYDEEKNQITQFFEKAAVYCSQSQHNEVDLRMEAMCPVLLGRSNLYVHAENERQLLEVVAFKQKMKIKKVVIIGGYDAPWVATSLKEENISVMIPRVHSLPHYSADAVDGPFTLAKQLHDAGVLFCFQNAGDMEAMNSRNLPFLAGTAVAYGLPYEEAVKGLTLNAAKILGMDQQYGSIEVGKSATFFLSTGDALDMKTNQLTHIFIDGRNVTVRNKQYDLYMKYKRKYAQDKK
jgi:imidazolonepropionase-like amidohydrolase